MPPGSRPGMGQFPAAAVSLSAKVSANREGEAAAARSTEPKHLIRQLRGDLEWITMKALERDRERRYASPSELAAAEVRDLGVPVAIGEKPGEVLIQTEFPDHPLLKSLLAEGYDGFARTALLERQQASWPPYSRLAAVRTSAKSAEAALKFLTEARRPPRDRRAFP